MNTIQTQDGYTKVRTHDFDAMEKELSELRSSLTEAQEHIAELEEQLEAANNKVMQLAHFEVGFDELKAQNEKMSEALQNILDVEMVTDFGSAEYPNAKEFFEARSKAREALR